MTGFHSKQTLAELNSQKIERNRRVSVERVDEGFDEDAGRSKPMEQDAANYRTLNP